MLTDVVSITTGYNHSTALKDDGTGDGTKIDQTTPIKIDRLDDAAKLYGNTYVSKSNGYLWNIGAPYSPIRINGANFDINKIENMISSNKYGSWNNGYYGTDAAYDDSVLFRANTSNKTNVIVNKDEIKENYILPNRQMIVIDNYVMITFYKNITTNQPLTIPFDGRKIKNVELGHIQNIGLVPFVYTNDGLIYYIDQTDL